MNVLITGVSRGLGYHISCKFLAEGHNVIGLSRSSLCETSPVNTLKDHNNFTYYQVDVKNSQEITKTLSHIYSSGMEIDLVILNAGGIENDVQNGFDYLNFQKIIELNFLSAMQIVNTLLPKFMERKSGTFVAISSVAAVRALSSSIGYPTSKAALSMAFKGFRLHYLNQNIRFITFQPGFLAERKVFLGTTYSKAAEIVYKHTITRKKSEAISFPLSIICISQLSKLFPDRFVGLALAKLLKKHKKL